MSFTGVRLYAAVAVLVTAVLAAVFVVAGGVVGFLVTYGSICAVGWWTIMRRHAARDRSPWLFVEVSQTLWFIGAVVELSQDRHLAAGGIGVSDIIRLSGYPLLTVGMIQMARRRAPKRLIGSGLDALTLAFAAAAVGWRFTVEQMSGANREFATAVVPTSYPVAGVILFAGVLLLAFSPGTTTIPTRLMIIAGCGYLGFDMCYHLFSGAPHADWLLGIPLLANAMVVGAELLPGHTELTRPSHHVSGLHPVRVVLLGGSMLVPAAIAVLWPGPGHSAQVSLIAAASGAMFILARFTVAVRDQDRAQAQLVHQARHDPLTGLANRSVLGDKLRRALPGSGYPVTVLYLNLDGFRAVNDAHGHDAGDAVLQAVARRLSAAVRESDLVVRLGGDEFVMLCPGVPASDAVQLADRILRDVAEPVSFGGHLLTVGASIGINAHVDSPGTAPAAVLRSADAAMYEAKRLGRGRWVLVGAQTAESEEQPTPGALPAAGAVSPMAAPTQPAPAQSVPAPIQPVPTPAQPAVAPTQPAQSVVLPVLGARRSSGSAPTAEPERTPGRLPAAEEPPLFGVHLTPHAAGPVLPAEAGHTPGARHSARHSAPARHSRHAAEPTPGPDQAPGPDQMPGGAPALGHPPMAGHAQTSGHPPMVGHAQMSGPAWVPGHGQVPGYAPSPGHDHAPAYGQTPHYGQALAYGQAPAYNQVPGHVPVLGHGQLPGYGQLPGHAQFSPDAEHLGVDPTINAGPTNAMPAPR